MAEDQSITIDPAFVADADGLGSEADGLAESVSEFSTASLAASIYEYRYENGRRYHAYKDGKYTIPNDQAEQERLDIIHHVYLILYKGELHMSPIDPNPERILDVGTGTGIWAVDISERYPSAEIIGTDLSPIQTNCVPNVQFQIDDAECEWTFGDDVFDFIHMRHLSGGISDWSKLLKEAYKAAKPGGWIEVAEFELRLVSDDGSLSETSSLWRYYDLVNQAGAKIGRDFGIAAALEPHFAEAGLKEVKHKMLKLPFGTWPADTRQKEMGAYLLLTASSAFEAFGYALLTRVMGMDIKEVEELVMDAKKDAKNRSIHSYTKQHVYWVQKPLENK